jgi:hypothetical protein
MTRAIMPRLTRTPAPKVHWSVLAICGREPVPHLVADAVTDGAGCHASCHEHCPLSFSRFAFARTGA